MGKSKVHMPKSLEKKCHAAIHSAATAAGAAGAIPIPLSDAVPITATQITMIIALRNVFGVSLSRAVAKSIAGVAVTQHAGRTIVSNILKAIPGINATVGSVIGAGTAVALTETLGWLVADDFFRMANGEDPQDIIDAAADIKGSFAGFRMP
ncbi:MAG: DUF697 domain-containing protein [Lachnospiraceae bacterium]|nr:DUF697 domain-containing protein [Lachnospiraceae bacterium]